jgi:hypothetical protein
MAGCQDTVRSLSLTSSFARLARILAAALLALLVFAALPGGARPAGAEALMCGLKVEQRTQYVSIDPGIEAAGVSRDGVLAAFEAWNRLFLKYHGFPIFAEHTGDWWDADILVTAQGYSHTWVATACLAGFEQRGANHSVVYLGAEDAWRNSQMLAHELGHALGLADYGAPAEHAVGHHGFLPCSTGYIGVMSYCTGPQSWFLDLDIPGVTVDGQVVARYW